MTASRSTRATLNRGWRVALLILVAAANWGCGPFLSDQRKTVKRTEKWTLHGKLYLINYNTFGVVVSVFRLSDDTRTQLSKDDFPEIQDLLDARQRTLNGRNAGATANFVQQRAVTAAAAGSSPLVYLLSANGFLARFDPSNPATAQRVNKLVCSSANVLGSGTRNFEVTPDGSLALVAVIPAIAGTPTPDTTPCIAFVDLNAMQVVHVITLPATAGSPGGIAITPDGRYAYLTTFPTQGNPSVVYVIDVAAVKILTTIPVPANGQSLDVITMSPDGSVAYLGCDICGLESIPVIDILTNTLSSPIPVQTPGSARLAVHPNGSKLYIVPFLSAADVKIVDTSSFKLIGTIPSQIPAGGLNPPPGVGPIFTPDGRFLLMLNARDSIVVVDTTTDRVDSLIPLNADVTTRGTFLTFFFVPDTAAQ